MVEAVLKDPGMRVTERLNHTQVGHVAGGEEQRSGAAGELGETTLQGLVNRQVAVDHVRGSGPASVMTCSLGHGLGQARVPREAQVVIAGKVTQPTRRPSCRAVSPQTASAARAGAFRKTAWPVVLGHGSTLVAS